MNVASLELCKELYELSGWENTDGLWYTDTWGNTKVGSLARIRRNPRPTYSAYDLGYLLRKLQDLEGLAVYRCHHQDNSWNWSAQCDDEESVINASYFHYADTPEDAICKLAIELFKEGALLK